MNNNVLQTSHTTMIKITIRSN